MKFFNICELSLAYPIVSLFRLIVLGSIDPDSTNRATALESMGTVDTRPVSRGENEPFFSPLLKDVSEPLDLDLSLLA